MLAKSFDAEALVEAPPASSSLPHEAKGTYDLAQTLGWKHGLHAKPADTKKFYGAIVGFTMIGVSLNFLGLNPMKFLVWSGIV